MSGLIQRLLDRSGGAVPQAASVMPAALSGSPLAAHDQRLQNPRFRDLGIGLLDLGGADTVSEPDVPASMPEPSRTVESEPTLAPKAPAADIAPIPQPIKPTTWQQIEDPIAALRKIVPETVVNTVEQVPAQTPMQSVQNVDVTPPKETLKPMPAAKPEPPILPEPAKPPSALLHPPQVEPTPPAAKIAPVQPPRSSSQIDPPAINLQRVAPEHSPTSPPDALPARAAPQAEPTLMRPTAPTRAMPELPQPAPASTPQPATLERQREVERIIERVTRQEATPRADLRPTKHREKPTAQSISRIGSLPTRRRAHTIFGLRRG
ncbi:MAG: hypothetical protein ACSHWS_07715 [Sulfitobacter sp.]